MTRNQIKVIAVLLMVVDHIGFFLLDGDYLFRIIGRLSFPLFVYLLADGFRRTRNLERYARRLLLFWLVSIVPYSLAFYGQLLAPNQNIFASLFLYLCLYAYLESDKPLVGKVLVIALAALFAYYCHLSYGWYGVVVAIILFYYDTYGQLETCQWLMAVGLLYMVTSGTRIQVFSALSTIFMPGPWGLAESKKPSKGISLLPYLFYPLHLLFFAFLKL